ncbi:MULTISPECIES: chloride channel protein [unclassified Cryobacterium]|uniref:chloride channel protein n=1 Tax=unclassified Cryobacterium TaxID=2649013 RepID=UPI001F5415B9|nr:MULTISPECIES: chloride channel protein [unclassified Cryobacterium]MEB0286974.1 chloride channel protein [Cryobacterium sp. 10S3]MEB0304952.1 chloride channel protein [Cryobacterium sp. 10I1]WPX15580.1 chloride channel protein [Cryobacterium sp. 10S3]
MIVAPAIGGLLYGPLVNKFAPEARGHGVPEVMYAITKRGGRIPGKVAIVKSLASAITIGSGGSVGREGPIVQIGSALGSTLGRAVRLPESQLRTLVACGAAGAIAATFNAPIAGIFFALELLLRDFAARSFGVVVLASVTASIVGRSILGDHPFLSLPTFTIVNPSEFTLFAVLGLAAGLTGVGFTKVLYAVEDLCDWAWRGKPEWLRPVAGGLVLGLVLFALPQMYGVGYPVLEKGVQGGYALGFVALLLVGKVVATSLTIGIGGSGGVFAPSLFIGAMLGAAFGDVAGMVFPVFAGQTGTFALVGMGAVFAGATRAPITAAIILFELTGEYSIILPLLLAIVIATGVSRLLSRDTIYTLKLRRRGVSVDGGPGGILLHSTLVREVMTDAPDAVSSRLTPAAGARILIDSGKRALPVLHSDGTFIGIVTVAAISDSLGNDDDSSAITLSALIETPTSASPDDTLDSVLDRVLAASESDGLPVVDSSGMLRGWLTLNAVLRTVTARP